MKIDRCLREAGPLPRLREIVSSVCERPALFLVLGLLCHALGPRVLTSSDSKVCEHGADSLWGSKVSRADGTIVQ